MQVSGQRTFSALAGYCTAEACCSWPPAEVAWEEQSRAPLKKDSKPVPCSWLAAAGADLGTGSGGGGCTALGARAGADAGLGASGGGGGGTEGLERLCWCGLRLRTPAFKITHNKEGSASGAALPCWLALAP